MVKMKRKYAHAPEPEAPQKKRKKKRRRGGSRILLYITLAFLAVVTLVICSLTVLFHIQTIEVTGDSVADLYPSQQIISASGLQTDVNIIMADTGHVEETLTRVMPYIGSVEVVKHFPSSVELRITRAVVAGQIESGGSYILIDENGKCLEQKTQPIKGAPVIRGTVVTAAQAGETVQFQQEQALELFQSIRSVLQSRQIDGITVIDIGNGQELSATYQNRIVLNFGGSGYLEQKADYAALIIEQQKSGGQTGVLNLSRIPNNKQQAYFTAGVLTDEQIADVLE